MAELATATERTAPADDDILPLRRVATPGLLKITMARIAAYVKAELGIPDSYFAVGGTPGVGKVPTWDGDSVEWATPAGAPTLYMRIPVFAVTAPEASEVLCIFPVTNDITFPANFANSKGGIADGGANPGATFTALVFKDSTQIGTIAISTSGVATFATASGTSKACAAGTFIIVKGPASADADIRRFAATLIAAID